MKIFNFQDQTSSKDYSSKVKRYGEGFFAVYKKAQRVAAYGKTIDKLWQDLEDKNVDAKKVVIMRLPPARWRYKS